MWCDGRGRGAAQAVAVGVPSHEVGAGKSDLAGKAGMLWNAMGRL
jgi:hypothetical protein